MASFNQVMLMGNITRDPQLKQLPSNTPVAEFGLACNRKYRSAQGEEREEVCFVDCTAFGKQAEVIHQYCQKGKPLFVQGRLRYDAWDDKQGGKRSKISVVIEQFQFIGGRDGNGSFTGAAADQDQRGESRTAPRGEDGERHVDHSSEQPERAEKRGDRNGRRQMAGAGRARFEQADIPF